MSGFSSPELLLIVVLALVVLGPKRLPEIANKIGGWIGQARRMTRVMKRQLEEELQVDEIKRQVDELQHVPRDDVYSPARDEDDAPDKPA